MSKDSEKIEELYLQAMSRPEAERARFLEVACEGDEQLRREVETLLAYQKKAGQFVNAPALDAAARTMGQSRNYRLVGNRLGPYEVLSLLGKGGMGEVYLARDTRLERKVALKVLPAELMDNPDRMKRFVQEAKAASRLNHPNIITIHEIDRAEGIDFLVMEYVPGKSLDELIPRKGIALKKALPIAIQMAEALAAAHAAGIVHRDLKPGNVMVSESGQVKVLDFGLAKLTEGSKSSRLEPTETIQFQSRSLTEEGTILGTVSYMSPEQAQGMSTDGRTDIFSFGAVLYEMLTGRRAFDGDSPASILSAILRDQPKPAAEIVQDLPRELDRMLSRCLRKDPDRRYQHAGDLKMDLQQVQEELASGASGVTRKRKVGLSVGRWWWLAVAGALIGISFTVGWWVHSPQDSPPSWKLTQLTHDPGLSDFSALSPDGKLVAYASDRGLDGGMDLYVKQVAGGQPIRLTSDGAGNTTPDFSPDGSKIVFRSNRDGGGIYEIPAFGGDPRRLARDGLNPKYSPDGSQVAYWVGNQGVFSTIPGTGTVWVIPVAGGPAQRVGANFTASRNPIWSPDGKYLLFIGYTSAKAYQESSVDWWLVATNGSDAVKTGAYDALVRAELHRPTVIFRIPECWSTTTNAVMFTANFVDTTDADNLWEIGISPRTGRITGIPRRLTTGAGNEVHPSLAPGGGLTFTNLETRTDVWSLPFDLDRGTPKGVIGRITQGPAFRDYPSLSQDGKYVAFASNQAGGPPNIWIRDLATGKESSVSSSSFVQNFPVINASGTRIAFSVFEKDTRVLYASNPDSQPEKLCEGYPRATDWSHDGKTVLVFGGTPYQINALDLASHQQTPLLKHSSYNLLYGRFSPDDRWVSFTVRTEPNRGHIAITSIDGPKPVPESTWITISPSEPQDCANWSPDGKTLYFTSSSDGHSCLWGQRLAAGSHRPVGEPFAVQHFHGRLAYQQGGWSAAGGRIALVLVEDIGNIWMMSRATAR